MENMDHFLIGDLPIQRVIFTVFFLVYQGVIPTVAELVEILSRSVSTKV